MGDYDCKSLLRAESHRFDDWVDEVYYVSRLTIVGADGALRTYEARAGDHVAARQQAWMLAASDRCATSQLLLSTPIPWSSAISSAPQGMNGGLGSGMPVLFQNIAAPTAAVPVTTPCLMPLGLSLTLPPVPGGGYRLQQCGYPARLPAAADVLQPNQLCAQAQQPQRLPSAAHLGVQVVSAGDTGAGPGKPLFRIDRKPSRVDNVCSSPTKNTASQEDGLISEDPGMLGLAGKSANRHCNPVNAEDSGLHVTSRRGNTSGFGFESPVMVFQPKQRRNFYGVDHACAQRSRTPSQLDRPPFRDHSPQWDVETGGPDVENCASSFKKRKTGVFKLVPADRPVIPMHTTLDSNKEAIVTENESDADDDYLTTYNELCQRGVANLEVPKYNYVFVSSAKMSSKWECCATIAATPPWGGYPLTISKTVSGKNKKDARRVAAKALLSELVEQKILSPAIVATKGIYVTATARSAARAAVNPESENKMNAKHLAEAAAAVSILNQLWQKEKFDGKPKWTLTPASSGATGHWKCSIFIRSKQYGDVSAECIQSQKKYAKHFAAYNAVQKLREQGCSDVDTINVQPKQQSNVVHSVADDCGGGSKSGLQSLNTMDEASKSRLDSALHHHGEVTDFRNDGDVNPGFGTMFQLPSTVKILIARNVGDVNEWIADNVADGAALGLCLDSRDLRKALEAEARECQVDVASTAFSSDECRAIALSTETSAILVAASLVESCVGTEWVPKSIKFMLERNECAKYGFGLDEGAIVLRYLHGINCANLNDLSSSSHALKEDWHARQGKAVTAAGLVSDWMNQKLSPFSNVCVESVSGLSEAVKSTEHVIAPVIILAVAGSMIRSRQRQEIERRRLKVVNRDDCAELSNRLWKPLGVAKPQFKMRRRLTR